MTTLPMRDYPATQPKANYEHRNAERPKAVGIVRPEVSGLEAPRHALEIKRHAVQMGYRYLYTVRPPVHREDPIGYALAIAIGVKAAAVVIYDLATVDHSPARVCDWCDLETVSPPTTWARSKITPEHARPAHSLTVEHARRIMQQHKACSAFHCPLKSAALSRLARAGKIVPPALTLRERAAARGIAVDPIGDQLPVTTGADARTLLSVLDGLLADLRADRRRRDGDGR